MSVTAAFLPVAGVKPSFDQAIEPRPSLHLRGTQLLDDAGLVIAEVVEGEDGRQYWQLFDDRGSQRLFQEVYLVGQGGMRL